MVAFFFGGAGLWVHVWGGKRFVLSLLLLGLGAHAFTDTLYAYSLLGPTYQAGHYLDVFWILGFAFIYWAADEHTRLPRVRPAAPPDEAFAGQTRQIEALLPAILGLPLLAVVYLFRDSLSIELLPYVLPAAASATLLLALRGWWDRRVESALRAQAAASRRRLREREASLANAQHIARLGNWDLDLVTDELYWSDEVYRIFGLQPQQAGASRQAFLDAVHPDDREVVRVSLNNAIRGHTPHSTDHRIVLPDGGIRFVHEHAEVMYDESGNPVRVSGTVQDITERARVEQALRESEDRLATALRQAKLGYWRWSFEDRRLAYWSEEAARIAGGSVDRPPASYDEMCHNVHPDDRPRVIDEYEAADAAERDFEIEYRVILDDGTVHHVRDVGKVERDAAGKPVAQVGTVQDVTALKQTEAALSENRQLLRAVIDAVPAMINAKDAESRYVLMNRFQAQLYGTDQDEALGKTAADLLGPDYGAYTAALDRKIFETGEALPYFEETMPDVTGAPHDWRTTKVPLRDENGRVRNVVTVALEISDIKQAERELRKLSRTVEQSPNGILITDLNGTIEYVNPRLTEMTGWSAAALVGQTPRAFSTGRPPRTVYDDLWRTIREGGEWRGTILNRRKNGELYWCRESVSAIRNATGEVIHYLVIEEDVTEHKRMEEDLRAARKKAEIADRAKSEFLANMSHELRTPLNAIIGFAELIKSQPFGLMGDAKYLEYVNDIHASGQHLLSVINDILDLSKVEAGQVELDESEVDVETVIDACLRLVKERAGRTNLTLSKELPATLPAVRADERKFKQILINLLSNALKFTPPGGRVTVAGGISEAGDVEIVVRDTGIGMKPEDIPRALQPFGQLRSSLVRTYEGTGLGLPLVRSLAELHGGSLEIASQPDGGTAATIRLPASRVVRDVRMYASVS
jgi:PAS domain S-box-containing protein